MQWSKRSCPRVSNDSICLPSRRGRRLPPTWPTRWSPGWTARRSRPTAIWPRRRRRRLDQWTRSVTDTGRQPTGGASGSAGSRRACGCCRCWHTPARSRLVPIDTALAIRRRSDGDERMGPPRSGCSRCSVASRASQRGQVALGQDEAWEFMSRTGPMLSVDRIRRAGTRAVATARHARRCTCSPRREPGSTVGVKQLSDVTWSVVFDDVELTAAEIARLARQARPMVESHGRWVAIDRLDLERAAAALVRTRVGHAADRRRDPPPEHRSRRIGPRRRRRRPRRQLGQGDRQPGARFAGLARPHTRALRRHAALVSGRGAGVDRIPRRQRTRWMPRPRHGARQDADRAGPPRPHARHAAPRWSSLRPRWSATGRPRPPGSPPTCACSCITGRRGPATRSWRRRSPRPTDRDHDLRHRGARRRRVGRRRVDDDGARRSAGDQEPGQRHRAGSCAASPPARGWR